MPEYFCITIHFLGNEYHGRGDQGQLEWPPSPLRVYQALVAANARLGNQADEALGWIENQKPPVIFAPYRDAIQPQGYTTYVPDNLADLVAKSWVKGGNKDISHYRSEKRIRSTLLKESEMLPAIHYLWPLKEGETLPACKKIIAVTRGISQLGWGIDLVIADATILAERSTTTLVGEQWVVSESCGGTPLRVPIAATLADLTNRYKAFLERISLDSKVFKPVPPISQYALANYRRASEMSYPPYAIFAIRKPDDSGFAPFSTTKRALHLSGMMRFTASQPDFAAALGWDDHRVASFVMGHEEHREEGVHRPVNGTRLVFIPLPSIEYRGRKIGQRIGAIRRVLVTVNGTIANEEFNSIVRHLEGRELINEKTGEVAAFLRRQSPKDGAINKYFVKSSEWFSVTPVILPGYDDPGKLRRRLNSATLTPQEKANIILKLEKRIEKLLRKALLQAGYPDLLVQHADLNWRGAGFMQGTDFATAYAVPSQHRRFRRLHVHITWRTPEGKPISISGPHCIGGGRFTGVGLLVSAQ